MFVSGPSLFHFQHGDHCCVFYQNDESLLDVLAPYILEGLARNERCFCAQKPELIGKLIYRLSKFGVNVARELNRGALEIHPLQSVYGSPLDFDGSAMMKMLEASITRACHEGFAGLRTAGELQWAAQIHTAQKKLCEYEQRVQATFPRLPAVGLCQYPLADFDEATLEKVLVQHAYAIRDTGPRHSNLIVNLGEYFLETILPKAAFHAGMYYFVQSHAGEIVAAGTAANFNDAVAAARQKVKEVNAARRLPRRRDSSTDSAEFCG